MNRLSSTLDNLAQFILLLINKPFPHSYIIVRDLRRKNKQTNNRMPKQGQNYPRSRSLHYNV